MKRKSLIALKFILGRKKKLIICEPTYIRIKKKMMNKKRYFLKFTTKQIN